MIWDVVFGIPVGFSNMSLLNFDTAYVPGSMENKNNSEQNNFIYSRSTDKMQTRICLPLSIQCQMQCQS